MNPWRDEYIQALQARDKREKASIQRLDNEFIDTYTKLLDHTAALEAEKAAGFQEGNPSQAAPSTASSSDEVVRLRSELAGALRSHGQIQTRLKSAEAELTRLKAKDKADTKLIDELSKARTTLSQKNKDKAEELRGKAKLLDDVQDELISLNLQLNMSEQKANKLKAENKDLIDRWMVRMGQEAEEMNKALSDPSTDG